MDWRRTAWLVATPLLAGASALVLGAAAVCALAVVLTPYEAPVPQGLDAGRAVLESTLGDLTDPRQLAPVAAGVLLAALTWVVGLGLGAQRLFPRRRRAIPAVAAVVLSALAAWVGLGLLPGEDGLWAVTVDDAVNAIVLGAVSTGLLVLLVAGQQWPTHEPDLELEQPAGRAPERVPARGKRVTAPRPAGLH